MGTKLLLPHRGKEHCPGGVREATGASEKMHYEALHDLYLLQNIIGIVNTAR
jgi:hypothetical protein